MQVTDKVAKAGLKCLLGWDGSDRIAPLQRQSPDSPDDNHATPCCLLSLPNPPQESTDARPAGASHHSCRSDMHTCERGNVSIEMYYRILY